MYHRYRNIRKSSVDETTILIFCCRTEPDNGPPCCRSFECFIYIPIRNSNKYNTFARINKTLTNLARTACITNFYHFSVALKLPVSLPAVYEQKTNDTCHNIRVARRLGYVARNWKLLIIATLHVSCACGSSRRACSSDRLLSISVQLIMMYLMYRAYN